MQTDQTKITVGMRFWSDAFSLKAIASCFPGRVEYDYDAGQTMRLPSGELSDRKAPRHYLVLKEYETSEPVKVPELISRCLKELWHNSYVASHIISTSLEAVLWITMFGEKEIIFTELCIQPEILNKKIGLVVENYTSLTDAGQPRRWVVGASPAVNI